MLAWTLVRCRINGRSNVQVKGEMRSYALRVLRASLKQASMHSLGLNGCPETSRVSSIRWCECFVGIVIIPVGTSKRAKLRPCAILLRHPFFREAKAALVETRGQLHDLLWHLCTCTSHVSTSSWLWLLRLSLYRDFRGYIQCQESTCASLPTSPQTLEALASTNS